MIDKIIQTKNHSYEMPEKKDNIKIKTFGDLHYFKKFDDRKLELISENLSKEELETVFALRKAMANMSVQEMTEQLINQIIATKSNEEFIERMKYFFKDNK